MHVLGNKFANDWQDNSLDTINYRMEMAAEAAVPLARGASKQVLTAIIK